MADRAKFYARDLFQTDLSPATVITMYLLPDVNLELRDRILALKPGTRIVTHDYDFGDWRPDDQFTMPSPGKTVGVRKESDVFFFVVPAKAAGAWRGTVGAGKTAKPLAFEATQKYQDLTMSGAIGGVPAKLHDASLQGTRLAFQFELEGVRYRADLYVVDGIRMSGVARDRKSVV